LFNDKKNVLASVSASVGENEAEFLPSGSMVARCAKQLERHAIAEYAFNVHQVDTRHVLCTCLIYQTLFVRFAKRFVWNSMQLLHGSTAALWQLTCTMNGAQLMKNLGHAIGDIKVVYARAVDSTAIVALGASGNGQ
jgi:hypothetical protein